MSLSLLQDYSSAEEEDDHQPEYDYSSGDEQNDDVPQNRYKPFFDPNPSSSSSSLLPSALDAFSEVSGPPQFLNNSVEEAVGDGGGQRWKGRKNRRDRNDLPAGAVVEAKPQLTGIHERVRSDVEGSISKTTAGQHNGSVSTTQGGKRVASVSNPNAEDAAELLRMCLRCGIPKTFSNAKGMVCPVCNDRPLADTENDAKKKGSTIKDKEKSKRMKGQSSHATWKSETEMQLRQQFD